MAAALGADVPFFLVGGTAIARGRGDRVSAIADAPSAWVVVVIPSFGVSTNDAYGWWRASGRASRPASAAGNDSDARNDLQPGVVARHPEIGRIVSALRRAGASAAAMSGSGSAVFGLFGSRASATRAAKAAGIVRYRTVVTTTLNRVQYQRLAAI
jgi:4-diphosphocytidyl-2-C-methyl-D-erythritol kinase